MEHLIIELRTHDLSDGEIPVPVVPFPYNPPDYDIYQR